ncbi:MAG: hypothetical protein JWN86_2660 [Planctomycetota bacterium]|nr:hypothetical protein [Planctomycetota bacterium]
MLLLSLIAALAGTPLRIAEAADDLAGSLAELGGGAGLEEVDGGVGDDSDATIRAEIAHAPVVPVWSESQPASLSPGLPPAELVFRLRAEIRQDCRIGPVGQHVFLQCFLC